MKYIIAMTGHAGHGKDASAELLKEMFAEKDLKVQRFAFADHLKEQAKLLGWNGEKDAKGRTLLQHLGDVMREYHGEDYYADVLIHNMTESDADICVITDLRFLNEAEVLRRWADGIENKISFVRIVRNSSTWCSALTSEQQHHQSELQIDQIPVDEVIHNDGSLEDLKFELYGSYFYNTRRKTPDFSPGDIRRLR